ncbi:MAG: sulfite reductase subunit alpha [Opitutaceae bacterium]|jgi:sulfite reductase (NADPH) flavoprotein alpha-component|nr:sulfite reductase subunit alpha [Opitutaceae bacterium]
MPVPVIPETAPFTPEQRAWLNGFLAGLFSGSAPAASAAPAALTPLTILYATQTGTAESLAKKAAKTASSRGFAPAILDVSTVSAESLQAHSNLLFITSTYGDGEPPDSAKALHTALATDTAPALAAVRYSVCALGDTNYTLFCQAGKDFDTYLEKRGATRVHPRADCDTDYDATFDSWLHAALAAFAPASPGNAELQLGLQASGREAPQPKITYSKSNPFPAPLLAVRALNAPGSAKEVNHVEFDLSAAGPALAYVAGDALGVIPQNCPALVAEVLAALGADGEEAVATKSGELPLRRALTECLELGKPTPALLDLLGLAATTPAPHHVIDALLAAANTPAPTAFAAALKPIAPRLYSISSSPKAHPGQVHLTVGAVRYELAGRARKGACSTFLAERALALGKVGVFVHSNKAFRPPSDPAAPMIMVGPGTGIAPFRAFLEERAATQAPGKNWLFFGDQKAATDFLYADELHALRACGVLTRLDLAFSRDQAEKIYVQHRMLENAAELFAWLEQGAHVYVCGDASRMAKDVDAALHQVVERAGNKTPAEAAAYVQSLKTAKRYQRDVY